jgi:hypothetical protein
MLLLLQTDYNHYQHTFKKLGTKTFARYAGVIPVLVTKDPELVKSVLVKHFDSFSSTFEIQVK